MCETFPSHLVLIGGDFNVMLAAEDRPKGIGGRDPRSVQFRDTLFRLGLVAMGPSNYRFTWPDPASQSRIDRFLCSPTLINVFPLVEVTSLLRPISDHSPLAWSSQVGSTKPTYFKMDRSWLRKPGFKEGIKHWWSSRIVYGTPSARVATKLRDLHRHLLELRRKICRERTGQRDAALARIQALDEMEDNRPLTEIEAQERRSRRAEVVEVDSKY